MKVQKLGWILGALPKNEIYQNAVLSESLRLENSLLELFKNELSKFFRETNLTLAKVDKNAANSSFQSLISVKTSVLMFVKEIC